MNRSIGFLQSSDIVKKRYKTLHGREASSTKARTIALYVEQGVNFLDSASNAPVTIRPLEQFYGVASLVRAITLFLNPASTGESTLASGHGLEVINWNVLNKEPNGAGFASLKIKTNKGLFNDLSESSKGLTIFNANSSRPNWPILLGKIEKETVINIGHIIGLLPDIWDEYAQWSGIQMNRVIVSSFDTKKNLFKLTTKLSKNDCKTLFPKGLVDIVQVTDSEVNVTLQENFHYQPVQLHHGAFDIGDTLLVPPIDKTQKLSTISIYYIVSYVMSMLARYRLSHWLAVWQREKGDSIRPLFEQIMNLIQEEFVQVCATMMDGNKRF